MPTDPTPPKLDPPEYDPADDELDPDTDADAGEHRPGCMYVDCDHAGQCVVFDAELPVGHLMPADDPTLNEYDPADDELHGDCPACNPMALDDRELDCSCDQLPDTPADGPEPDADVLDLLEQLHDASVDLLQQLRDQRDAHDDTAKRLRDKLNAELVAERESLNAAIAQTLAESQARARALAAYKRTRD